MFSVEHLNALRQVEIADIVAHLHPRRARVLEIGAGTGRQAMELKTMGFDVEAIEIPSSNYTEARLFPITDYDGRVIPFPPQSFDIVFSSNVLEHVPDLGQMHAEIRRVLRPGGYALHVMPTHSWRFWTTLTSIPDGFLYAVSFGRGLLPPLLPRISSLKRFISTWWRAVKRVLSGFLQRRHGERGNFISELWLFHPSWWRKNFLDNGFDIVNDEPMGLFYTGNMLFGAAWPMNNRRTASRFLGSACHIFKVKPRT